jgi:hypothetical protein
MIKKILIIALIAFAFPFTSTGQTYIGGGAGVVTPIAELANTNQMSYRYHIQIESRRFCNLWYGLRIDYVDFKEKDDLDKNTDYYTNAMYFSPEIRYNFLSENCFDNFALPYAQVMLTISSIGNTDETGRMGLGGGIGGGLLFPFRLWGACWGVDLNALYTAPNFISSSGNRYSLQSVDVSLSLSVSI